jgi:polygalacturonase
MDHIKVISKGTGKTGASNDICILNGDGIDIDSSIYVNVFDSFFLTGDDAVAIKSGRDREGNELNKPSAYIRVTDCASVGSKGGFCIGSEQAAGAHDILWQNLLVKDIELFGLWIKASPSRGGLIRDILWKDCMLDGTQGGIFLENRYHGFGNNPARTLPEIGYITFENICSKTQKYFGIHIAGLKDSYIHDILFRGCSFEKILDNREEAFEVICGQNIAVQNMEIPEGYSWSTDEISIIIEETE